MQDRRASDVKAPTLADRCGPRIFIEDVYPAVDEGRFAVKRIAADPVEVWADIFRDGHAVLAADLLWRAQGSNDWSRTPMRLHGNDRWTATFAPPHPGRYLYTIEAWTDLLGTWRHDLLAKRGAGQDVKLELEEGRSLAARIKPRNQAQEDLLRDACESCAGIDATALLSEPLAQIARRALRADVTRSASYPLVADRTRARAGAWYEMMPRSQGPARGRHGTFDDCIARLPDIAAMGFDVVYLPPIHPIGRINRKGRNNSLVAGPDDPGSPYAIGSVEGGHDAVHRELGTLADFRRLVKACSEHGMEVALDFAIQCAPDHPYVRQHPEWFRWRPDETIQYAENPPKKYEDIYPFEFESLHWRALWNELKSIPEFWIEQGVRVFRVDNPHTKPFDFWEWMIRDLKKKRPDLIFLSEAFTRPNIMYQLAKLGFTQSYTYFTWRNTKKELTDYVTELTQTEVPEFFRPNFWPNTPDILHEYLQHGGRPAFMARLVLAATLGANYGIYGPAYELCESTPREPGSEEYLNSEKYEIKHRDLHDSRSLRGFISRVNAIRKENPALQSNERLRFHAVDNDQIIAYSKHTADRRNVIITVVNLDPVWTQSGFLDLQTEELGINIRQPYRLTDLITGSRFTWQGARNYVELRPEETPAHILRVE